jgi:uncharacterized membrane protein YvbJ
MFCKNCGKEVAEGLKFCTNFGTRRVLKAVCSNTMHGLNWRLCGFW